MKQQENMTKLIEERSKQTIRKTINEAELLLIRIVDYYRSPFDVCWALFALGNREECYNRPAVRNFVSYIYNWCLQKKYTTKRDIVALIMSPHVLKKFGKKLPSDYLEFTNKLVIEFFEERMPGVYTESFEYLYSIVASTEKIPDRVKEKIIDQIKIAAQNDWFSDLWRCALGIACLIEMGVTNDLFQNNLRWLLSHVRLNEINEEEIIIVSWLMNTYLRRQQLDKEIRTELENLNKKVTKRLIDLSQTLKDTLLTAWTQIGVAEENSEPELGFAISHLGIIELSLLIITLSSLLPELLICYSTEEHEKIREELKNEVLVKEKRKTGSLLLIMTGLFLSFMYTFYPHYREFTISIAPETFAKPLIFLYFAAWFFIPPQLILNAVDELLGRKVIPKRIYEILITIVIGIIEFIIQILFLGGI